MINKAVLEEDSELFRRADKYRLGMWENVMIDEANLIYHGRFSYKDVQEMPVVERTFFLNYTRDRLKETEDSIQGLIGG